MRHGVRTFLPAWGRGLAISLALLGTLGACGEGESAPRPSIVLITLDTTRRDRLSCYGYPRSTTPNLDALAREGLRYTRAYAVSSWTLPAHATLFTGKVPTSHGAMYDPEGPLRLAQGIEGPYEGVRARGLSEEETTLAEVLRDAGYTTGGVVAGPWLMEVFGLDAGFDFWDDRDITQLNGRPADEVTRSAIEWIDGLEDEPFFLFLNYFDPHFPPAPRLDFRPAFAPVGQALQQLTPKEETDLLYDVEVCFMDHHIGVLFDALRERGLYEDAWIIAIADHGELLGENNEFGHGRTLTEEEIHVPLLVKRPGPDRPTGIVDDFVQQTDLMPLILGELDLRVPRNTQGNVELPVTHPLFAEVYPLPQASEGGDWRMLRRGDRKYLWNSKGNSVLLDLSRPFGPGHDVTDAFPDERDELDRALARYLESLPRPGAAGPEQDVGEDITDALENTGYLGDGRKRDEEDDG